MAGLAAKRGAMLGSPRFGLGGWGKDRKDEIARRVTEAIHEVTKLPKEAVWVVVEEVDPPDWYVAGKPGERMKK